MLSYVTENLQEKVPRGIMILAPSLLPVRAGGKGGDVFDRVSPMNTVMTCTRNASGLDRAVGQGLGLD